MTKNIVFCADGTWNGTGGPDEIAGTNPTNVLKLFWMLAGDVTPEGQPHVENEITTSATGTSPEQRAKYLHGVGDTSNPLAKLAEGSLGLGLIARVLRGYTFISRNYAPGDAIYITGFSRGAYTARALGGLISSMGLLDWQGLGLNPNGADDNGYKYAASAWSSYQYANSHNSEKSSLLGRIELAVADNPQFLSWLAYRPLYIEGVEIVAIGVFDTVGALGIPETGQADTVRLDLLRFADTKLSDKVAHGFHAIAADEQRVDFTPTLWDDRKGVIQQLFPGVHSDVGGGYPMDVDESYLSDIAGAWMQERLASVGVLFSKNAIIQAQSTLGPMHAPWLASDFFKRPTATRIFPVKSQSELTCHPTFQQRLGHKVRTMNPDSATFDVTAPYVPLALINAGYVSVEGISLA
jgi:glutathione S-transferase